MDMTLFGDEIEGFAQTPEVLAGSRQRELGQWMTPHWLAACIVEKHFGDLTVNDLVVEPTCGTGAFLAAIPKRVRAVGIEIDEKLAEAARQSTGRKVMVGDFRKAALDEMPTAVIGNPPFEMGVIDSLLELSHKWLPNGGRVGLLLPCYALQTASRVARYNQDWSIEAEMIPRNVFKGLQCPLAFTQFRKDKRRHLVGLAFYEQAHDVSSMPELVQDCLRNHASGWRKAVEMSLKQLGGSATLESIYEVMSPKRPTGNPHWKAQVRKVIRGRGFVQLERARYALAA